VPLSKIIKSCQLVRLWSVCGAQSSNYVNVHFLLSCLSCLWSFSGVSALSVVSLWCQNFKFCQFTLPPFVSTLSVVVFRCLWSVCGLSVVPKVQILSIYTFSYHVHPFCGRFQVSVLCLWSVCGAKSLNSANLHCLLSFPPCLWSFSGVSGLSVVCLWCLKFKF
jgi:hypothetical protein